MKKKTIFLSVTVLAFVIAVISIISCTKEETPGKDLATCGTCNWYGTSFPVCCNTSSGWGWENNASCIAKATCTGAGQTCSGCSSSSSSGGGSGTCPSSVSCPFSGVSCGCYLVSGLGSNKQAISSAGGSQYMMACAMLETEAMNTNYTYGDGKSGDSFNAGRCKLNYYEARMAGVGQGSTSAFWNKCASASGDVQVWNACRSYWGSKYWAVTRNGQSGANNPNTTDINNFKKIDDWNNSMLNGHTSDNVRFWSNGAPAI